MNPYKYAEHMLSTLNDAANDGRIEVPTYEQALEQAKIWAILALSTSIDGLGHDLREAGRDIATEIGGMSVTLGRD